MRRFTAFAFILLFFAAVSCKEETPKISAEHVSNPATASGDEDKDDLPVFKFESETYDFGKITQGEVISFTYKFENTGKSDLIISSARGSCGCTVPEYPKQPIPPGEEGIISVEFNSEGKSGKQNKTITLIANTEPNTKILTLKGEVVAPKQK